MKPSDPNRPRRGREAEISLPRAWSRRRHREGIPLPMTLDTLTISPLVGDILIITDVGLRRRAMGALAGVLFSLALASRVGGRTKGLLLDASDWCDGKAHREIGQVVVTRVSVVGGLTEVDGVTLS